MFANLAVAAAKAEPPADAAETDGLGAIEDDVLLSDALTLVIAAESGRVVVTAEQARAETDLLLHFQDGAVPVRVEPDIAIIPSATTH